MFNVNLFEFQMKVWNRGVGLKHNASQVTILKCKTVHIPFWALERVRTATKITDSIQNTEQNERTS